MSKRFLLKISSDIAPEKKKIKGLQGVLTFVAELGYFIKGVSIVLQY